MHELSIACSLVKTAVDEAARTWSWSVACGPLRLSFEHGVDEAQPGLGERSEAWVVVLGAWPVVIGYAPIARHALARLVAPAEPTSALKHREPMRRR